MNGNKAETSLEHEKSQTKFTPDPTTIIKFLEESINDLYIEVNKLVKKLDISQSQYDYFKKGYKDFSSLYKYFVFIDLYESIFNRNINPNPNDASPILSRNNSLEVRRTKSEDPKAINNFQSNPNSNDRERNHTIGNTSSDMVVEDNKEANNRPFCVSPTPESQNFCFYDHDKKNPIKQNMFTEGTIFNQSQNIDLRHSQISLTNGNLNSQRLVDDIKQRNIEEIIESVGKEIIDELIKSKDLLLDNTGTIYYCSDKARKEIEKAKEAQNESPLSDFKEQNGVKNWGKRSNNDIETSRMRASNGLYQNFQGIAVPRNMNRKSSPSKFINNYESFNSESNQMEEETQYTDKPKSNNIFTQSIKKSRKSASGEFSLKISSFHK